MRSRAAAGSDAGTSYTMGDGLRDTTQPLRLGDEQAAGSEEDRMLRHLAGTWPSSHAESKRYTAHLEGQGGANLVRAPGPSDWMPGYVGLRGASSGGAGRVGCGAWWMGAAAAHV